MTAAGRPVAAAVLLMVTTVLAGCVGGGGDIDGPGEGGITNGTGDGLTGSNGTDGSLDDLRAHVHDRWFDASERPVEELTVVDGTFEVVAADPDDPSLARECRYAARSVCYGSVEFRPTIRSDGTGAIVPPGTSHLTIDVSYDPSDFPRLLFYTKDRVASGNGPDGRHVDLIVEPDTTFELNLTDVRQADDGHAEVSAWSFVVEPFGNPTGQATDTLSYGEGPVTVTVTAHRVEGPLPLEPPHPTFWESTSIYRIGYLADTVADFAAAGPLWAEPDHPPEACPTGLGSVCLPVGGGDGIAWEIVPGLQGFRTAARGSVERTEMAGPSWAGLVPPGTRLLTTRVLVEGEASGNPQICLHGWSTRRIEDAKTLGCGSLASGTLDTTWDLAVTGRDVDSFYANNTGQNSSRWFFRLTLGTESVGSTGGVARFSGDVTLALFVTDEDTFSEPAWALQPPPS